MCPRAIIPSLEGEITAEVEAAAIDINEREETRVFHFDRLAGKRVCVYIVAQKICRESKYICNGAVDLFREDRWDGCFVAVVVGRGQRSGEIS